MIAMLRELSVPISDLRYVAVECRQCASKVTVDLTKQTGILEGCPVCGNLFDRRRIALCDEERRHQFGIGIDGDPRPHVTRVLAVLEVLRFGVLLFGVNERPYFIDLKPFAWKVHQSFVHVD